MRVKEHYADETLRIYQGDSVEVLKGLEAGSVNCCVTSPPYWGLRDYGTAKWEGGDAGCDHSVGGQVEDGKAPGAITSGQRPGVDASVCRKCGARRIDAQLGLESTPEEYVANLVAVFREVRRVLRDDGTVWLNLGDSYASGNGSCKNPGGGSNSLEGHANLKEHGAYKLDRGNKSDLEASGLKPKDLVGIPWRVAFALQADGWWLRQDIIWSKPNPMPESVTDRCTKAHEYVFLLSKSGSAQFWSHRDKAYSDCWRDQQTKPDPDYRWENQDTDEETEEEPSDWRTVLAADGKTKLWRRFNLWRGCDYYFDQKEIGRPLKELPHKAGNKFHEAKVSGPNDRGGSSQWETSMDRVWGAKGWANKKSVWTVSPFAYKGAHFATFPPDLIRPCILAGCPKGGTVLDCFGGSGTTAVVSEQEGRKSVLIELNPDYMPLIEKRTQQRGLFSLA